MNQKELFKTSTSSAEASRANRSVLQARKKARKMTDTSGRTCMKLLNTKNPLGSLSKTLVASSMWHSMMCVLTWKPKVTPRNRLLFQLAVSKLPTEETESGSSERTWRTPDAHCGRGGSSKERMQMKLDKGMPISLNDQVAHPDLMWPTPNSRDWKDSMGTVPPSVGKTRGHSLGQKVAAEQMKMFPTPTTMDSKEDSLKHATKMLQGKTHRASGQPIQKTLADRIMMEEILKNPELMELYQDHQMVERPHLPEQQKFVKYLRSQTTIKELAEKTDIKKTTIEHWFRKDKAGFSHPSIEDWETIKPHLKDLKYDKEMTTLQSIEWQNQKMFPTPAARDYKDTGENTDYEKLAKKSKLAGAVKSKMYPTPRSSIGMSMTMDTVVNAMDNNDRGYKGNLEERVAIEQKMWPTPNASDNRDRGNMSDPAIQRRLAKGKQVGLTMAVKDKPGKGTLNPEWVEWMMGYPPGWTDISDSQ